MKIKTKNLSWGVDGKKIVENITLEIKTGDLVGLVGPNGSGKSSLLRLIYRFYKPLKGSVFLGRNDISSISLKEIAKKMAVVPQERGIFSGFTVYEVVAMGRTPYKGLFDNDTQDDHKIILRSLKKVKLLDQADRFFNTLSGGERQRVLIALALAQKAEILALDEPTNHLDPLHQLQIMEIIKDLRKTTIMAMHDLNMAARYCDRILLIDKGKIIAYGKPEKILTSKNIQDVYGVKVKTWIDKKTGKLSIVLLGINENERVL
ncbi:MAG: ABC transporter ATP-binding protein [Candidatus Dojkabacteria bacterium]|nr:ABC transporter ATP-binding protein [Candidatus Dojkabacteria bacterium]